MLLLNRLSRVQIATHGARIAMHAGGRSGGREVGRSYDLMGLVVMATDYWRYVG